MAPGMPELPEVEIARRDLLRWTQGHRVLRAVADPQARTFRGADPRAFAKLKGQLTSAERKGKYLLVAFDSGYGALLHLGMTGKLVRRPSRHEEPYSRARFLLDDGHAVHFRDPRLFGRIEPVKADALWHLPPIRALGPDPLVDGLTPSSLEAALSRSKQPLKVALMDQGRLAGLGNIHAAEALYRARLHPSRQPGTLTRTEWGRLSRAIHASLKFALQSEGEGDGDIEYVEEPGAPNPFLIYGRAGEQCRRCQATVQSFVQGGRTTHFCPSCQPPLR